MKPSDPLRRRQFLGLLGGGAAAFGASSLAGPTAGASPAPPAPSGPPVVETTYGPVRGTSQDGVLVFRGVPYAASPVGPLRYRPPAPPTHWTTVRDASQFGPAVPQVFPLFPLRWSEDDCLNLNIWTPSVQPQRKRPVLVWALDGAHMIGFPQMVDGQRLAQLHDVVVVSVSIRLGALGFLWLGDSLGHDFAASGNLGSLDHQRALRWVRDNIERFGGDPGQVTALGISGAAGSTLALMAMPSARGLIRRATIQSGDQTLYRNFAEAGLTTDALFGALDLSPADRHQILDLPVARIVEAQKQVLDTSRPLDQSTWFGPVVGTVLPRHPLDALRRGASAGVDVIAGSVRDEFTFEIGNAPGIRDVGEAEVRTVFDATFPGEGDDALEAYEELHRTEERRYLVAALFGDRQFGFGGVRLAEARHEAGGRTWIYHFRWASPVVGQFGSRHGIDWPFTFDTLAGGGGPVPLGPNPPQALADTLNGAWMRFVRGRHVGHGWRPYDPERPTAMIFDAESHVEKRDALGDLRGFWRRSRSGIDLGAPWVWPSP